MEHSRLSPSSSSRWLECTASIKAIEDSDTIIETSEYAKEGTLAHSLADKIVKNEYFDEKDYDNEMIEYANNYVDYLNNINADFRQYEVKVKMNKLPSVYGTVDAILINDDTMYVIDLKYGKRVKIEAKNNTQLMIYAMASYSTFNKESKKVKFIELHIYQPRAFNISSHKITIEELISFFKNKLKPSVDEILSEKTHYRPGNNTCIWCPVKGNCKSAYNHLNKYVIKKSKEDLSTIESQDLAVIMDNTSFMKKFLDEVKNEAFNRIEKGDKNVTNYEIGVSKGSRKYSKLAKDEIRTLFGDSGFDTKLKGIIAIEKLSKLKGIDLSESNIFETKPESRKLKKIKTIK